MFVNLRAMRWRTVLYFYSRAINLIDEKKPQAFQPAVLIALPANYLGATPKDFTVAMLMY
jgi:hypothetical protein